MATPGITTLITASEILEQKKKLEEILAKYKVKKAEEIEKKIKKGEIAEHPSYEDYLSALSYEKSVSALKKAMIEIVKDI